MTILQMSISGSILIIGIIIFRALAMHHITKKVFVVLWVIAILRLLIPFSFSMNVPSIGMFTAKMLKEQKEQFITKDSIELSEKAEAMSDIGQVAEAVEAKPIKEDKIPIAFAVWIFGVFLSSIIMIILYCKDAKLLKEAIPYTEKILPPSTGKKQIKIFLSDRISTPLSYGIWKPCIIIPKAMKQKEEGALSYILQHEIIHIKRHDNLWKLLAMITVCVHFYNPLVWIMLVLINRDLELRCDEEVIRLHGAENRKSYALTLLSFAEEKNNGFAAGMGFGKNAIKERLEAIMKYKKLTIAGAFLATVVITASLTVFITSQAADTEKSTKEYVYELAEAGSSKLADTASVEYAGTAETREEIYAPYEEVGILYDKDIDRLFLEGKKIKELYDKEKVLMYTVPDGEGCYEITYQKQEMKIKEVTEKEADKLADTIYKKQEGIAGAINSIEQYIAHPKKETEHAVEEQVISKEEAGRKKEWMKETKQSIQDYADKFSEYGLTVSFTDTDYQFYFNEEPVCFVADNKATDGGFSGSVYFNADHGTKGVITIRDASGVIGMKLLSEEETEQYNKRYW